MQRRSVTAAQEKNMGLLSRMKRNIGSYEYDGDFDISFADDDLGSMLQTLEIMLLEQKHLSAVVFYNILQHCIDEEDISTGRRVQTLIIRAGLEANAFLGSHLIRMFASWGSISEAKQVFCKVSNPNTFTWNAIICGHVKWGQDEQAMEFYHKMSVLGLKPDAHVLVTVLKACTGITSLMKGKLIHLHLLEIGFDMSVYASSSLIDMYLKCGDLEDAFKVLTVLPAKTTVACNAMIAGLSQYGLLEDAFQLFRQMQIEGYVQRGLDEEALSLFKQMGQENMEPNQVTVACILKACSSAKHLDHGRVIQGYAQYGEGLDALELFKRMQEEGIEPNQVTFVTILYVCSDLAALYQGKVVHAHVIMCEIELDLLVCNSLIDMYVNCGSLHDAYGVLERTSGPSSVTWNTMVAGCAQNSDYELAVKCLKGMQLKGIKPNEVTFVCLLSLCNHMGLVAEGYRHFKSMREDYEIIPTYEHYTCILDLLGRSGSLVEAEDLLNTVPFSPKAVGLTSLLSHCRTHGSFESAKMYFNCATSTDSHVVSSIAKNYGSYECQYRRTTLW